MEKRQTRVWYACSGFVSVAFLSAPFLWRSSVSSSLMLCLGPCFALIALISIVIYLSKSLIQYKHIVIGTLAAGICFFVGLRGDSFARETIFRLNYPAYRLVVLEVMTKPPPKSYGKTIARDRLKGFGIHSGSYEEPNDVPVITLETASGPSLETVRFSPKPIKGSKFRLELKRKDDLGYWYFVHYR